MIGDPAAMRAWLDAHGLVEAELLHVLPNHGPDGADLLTDPERLLLSELLEVRRAVIPGDQPTRPDRSTAEQERPCSAEPAGLFDPAPGRPPERAGVQPASRHARPADRPAARQYPQPPAARQRRQREQEEERQR